MIISHKHKYIFWKPGKVGGSSVLQMLGEFCGPQDVVGQPGDLEGHQARGKNRIGGNHVLPGLIRRNVTKKQWDSYYKFTIVRNPWDEIVSRFWHDIQKGRIENIDLNRFSEVRERFEGFLPNQYNINLQYYISESKLLADHYMRFENLSEEYRLICDKINIPYKTMIRMKSHYRKDKRPYPEYYSESGKEMVYDRFRETIDIFGYEF